MAKSSPSEPAFFTVNYIADRWHCSPKTVRRLIAAGEIPVYRLGNSVRISREDLFTYERSNRIGARET